MGANVQRVFQTEHAQARTVGPGEKKPWRRVSLWREMPEMPELPSVVGNPGKMQVAPENFSALAPQVREAD